MYTLKMIALTLFTVIHTIALWIPERILWLIGIPVIPIALCFKQPFATRNGFDSFRLPGWADWCWGNRDDGVGDENHAVNDCGAVSLESYNEGSSTNFWLWLAFRNPCHNLSQFSLFSADLSKIKYVDWFGDVFVDNRLDSKGICQSGFQVVSGLGKWYFRSGLYYISKPNSKGRVIRLRMGYKLQPRHFMMVGDKYKPSLGTENLVTWTLSFSPSKRVLDQ